MDVPGWIVILCFVGIGKVSAGLQTPNKYALYKSLFGAPCNCKGGTLSVQPSAYTRQSDCGEKTAYLRQTSGVGQTGIVQNWVCVKKPKIIPAIGGKPGQCPIKCKYQDSIHSSCYSSIQQCTRKNNQTYFTAILVKTKKAVSYGDWANTPKVLGHNKYLEAFCMPHLYQI